MGAALRIEVTNCSRNVCRWCAVETVRRRVQHHVWATSEQLSWLDRRNPLVERAQRLLHEL
jgi:hypothetical protein